VPGSFDDDAAFDNLAQTLDDLRERNGIQGNAAFYFSIPPAAFPLVLNQLNRTGMADNAKSGGWRRVVVEKPFGNDLETAIALNQLVDEVFTPQDVYRIDHYLGKETVQNILALRFANSLFEPVWNSKYVDSVQITMAEDVGIGTRAAFYDASGAARDVLQNHLLQLLALVAMEEPTSFDPQEVRAEKLKVLKAIRIPADIAKGTVRGQYLPGWVAGERAVGYLEEKDIPSIEHPNDAIVQVTCAAICGSDLHLYHGMMPDLRVGHTFGHEFVGTVHAVGSSVEQLEVGDRVLIPFTICCGSCFFCARGLAGNCHNVNPNATGWWHLRLLAYMRRLRRRAGGVRPGAVC